MSIRIFMKTLRIFVIALERIKPIETTCILIVIARPEIFHLETGIELLACIQQISGTLPVGYVGVAAKHLAVGVIRVIGGDSAIITGQLAGAAVAVIQQVTSHTANILTQNIVTKNIAAPQIAAKRGGFFEHLSVTDMPAVEQEVTVLRNAVDRLLCAGADSRRVVRIAGSDGYILQALFPGNVRRCKTVAVVVTILTAELSCVYFTCQRAADISEMSV